MSSSRFLGGILIGGALGAILGMLLAPRSGEETRQIVRDELSNRLQSSVDTVKTKSTELKDKANLTTEQLRARTQEIATELESAGRETWDKVAAQLKSSKPVGESAE